MGKIRDRLAKVVELAAHDKPAALQAAIMLLRSVGVHRMSHLLHVTRPADLENATEAHDQLLLRCFSKMLGGDDCLGTNDRHRRGGQPTADSTRREAAAREQAKAPLSLGGIGLGSAARLAPAAYLAGAAAALAFVSGRMASKLHPPVQGGLPVLGVLG